MQFYPNVALMSHLCVKGSAITPPLDFELVQNKVRREGQTRTDESGRMWGAKQVLPYVTPTVILQIF